MAAGLAGIPAAASAATASPSSPAGVTSAAAEHAAPQSTGPATLAQLARSGFRQRGQAQRTGVITGTVVGAYGLPVTGACVTAVGRAASVTAFAGPAGSFTIGGLAAGSYTLEYRDCSAHGRYDAIWSGGASWQRTATRVLVGAGQVRHVPAMMLPASPATVRSAAATWHRFLANASGSGLAAAAAARTGQISGVVTGNGRKLRGVCILVMPAGRNGSIYAATTRKNGSYLVRHIRPGSYDVSFGGFCANQNWLQQVYRGDNSPFGFGGTPVPVKSGTTTTGIDARLRLGGEITGIVTTRSGRKLGGICVNAQVAVPGGQVGLGLQTQSDGSFQLHALYPGKWTVDFGPGCGDNANYAPAVLNAIKITYGKRVTGRKIVLLPGAVLTGVVRLGTSSGQPLAGICVQASNGTGPGISFSGQGPGSGATNAAGRYRLTGLATGTYQVYFSPGCNNNGNYTSATKYAHATAGKVTGSVNAVLVPGAEISGTVTDSHGHPLAGLCIDVVGSDSGNSPYGTLSDGTYYVDQLPAGTYQLGFSTGCGNSGNYAPYWYDDQTDISQAKPIKLTRGESLTINAQLRPGAAISGTITDSHGRKLSGVCVEASTADSFGSLQLAFAEHGSYELTGLAPGKYQVDFGCGVSNRYADQWFPNAPDPAAADAVSVPVGRTSGINAVLRPGGAITGMARSQSGKPLPGVCVSAVSTRDRAASASTVIIIGSGGSTGTGPGPVTNSRGVYRLSGLAAGRYLVQFFPCAGASRDASQWYKGHASQRSAMPVTVQAGGTTGGISATMRLGAGVTGRVVNSSGKPLRNICAFAYNDRTGQAGFSVTGKTGRYQLSGLATGSYTIGFNPCSYGVNLVAAGRHIKVTAPRTITGVNARLVPGGSASGVVTAAGSAVPVANGCVQFSSANPANAGGFGFTDANGKYLATGLAPGSYQVYFNDPQCGLSSPGLAPQWYNDRPTQATANMVTITVGHTVTGIDAALQADGTITGTVRGRSNTPLSGACVTAMPLAAGLVPVVAVSGKAGGFTLTDMLPGRYKVEFSAGCGAVGYRTQWWQLASSRQHATPVGVAAAQVVTGIDATLTR